MQLSWDMQGDCILTKMNPSPDDSRVREGGTHSAGKIGGFAPDFACLKKLSAPGGGVGGKPNMAWFKSWQMVLNSL